MWGYHGFWPLDFDKIDSHLYTRQAGMPDGDKRHVKQLADSLHEAGMKLIMDVIVNHTGYNHPALMTDNAAGIRTGWFNPAYLEPLEDSTLLGLPELDLDNIEAADYFINMITDWVEQTGVDCLRLYASQHLERVFWFNFKNLIKSGYPNITLLGETPDWDLHRMCEFQKYYPFDFLFDFKLQQLMTDVFICDKSILAFAYPHLSDSETLGTTQEDTNFTNHNRLITLLDNHDLPKRFVSEALDHLNGDPAGAVRIYKLAISFLMTVRGVPQIYYGNEIALEGYGDPDNRRDMPWEIFDDRLEPGYSYLAQREVFRHMKKMIEIRKASPALSRGSLSTLYVDGFIYAFLREYRGEAVIVVINNGNQPMKVPLLISLESNASIPPRVRNLLLNGPLKDLLDDAEGPGPEIENGSFTVQLDGKSARIYKVL
jgi:alpha-amylase